MTSVTHNCLAGRVIKHTVVESSSYKTLTTLFSLHRKSHKNLSLLNFKCAARISTRRGTPTHQRARMRAGNFENDPCKIRNGT